MNFDVSALSRLQVSTGILYFLKYVFLAAVLGFVYYVADIVFASLKEASGESRLSKRSSSNAEGGTVPENKSRFGSVSKTEAGSLLLERTVTHKPGQPHLGISSGSMASSAESAEEMDEVRTFTSLHAAVETCGFIEIVSGVNTQVKRIPLEREAVTFGRARDCTVKIRDGFASAHHAKVCVTPDGVILEDMGSRNGTYLDDQRIEEAVILSDGDVFSVGDAVFRYSSF